ncbi:MAG: hypothetical protein S4CHLAM45_13120 [Chlamydiales bacterium]|nr:hypothetical protein [Chlamydiales bacterium]MCH9619801.1 hypothetical protein [Chlamydiales bacterium]MCH9623407.1 hypothetical protein [Chlamydiales bacterium]
MSVDLYDQTNIETLVWPKGEESVGMQHFFLPLLKEGVSSFVSNIETTFYLLKVDDLIFPLTVNEMEYDNSYLTSNYFLISSRQERGYQSFFHRGLVTAAGGFLKGVKINRSVLVNNWLLSAATFPQISLKQLRHMTEFLVDRFPSHTLMFRNLFQEQLLPFHHLKYGINKTREVYCYDPGFGLDKKARYHHRRDHRLISKLGYHILRGEELQGKEERIIDLYNQIYIKKHTNYSPHYTEKFIKSVFKSSFFSITALEKEGQIDGVFISYRRDKSMSVPFFGYQLECDYTQQVYRMLTILAMGEAKQKGLFLNDGSGGTVTKAQRGMRPFSEYIAFYGRHLSHIRRAFWALADHLTTSPTIK